MPIPQFFPAVEVEVKETLGSSPREAGARMWVNAAATEGTVGGGNLEYIALKVARELLHDRAGSARRERRFALGDSLGQCCGGQVTLAFTRHETAPASAMPQPAFDVLLLGAGHVGREIARILERLPCRLTWIDPRPDAFPADVAATTKVVIEEEPEWMVAEARPGAYYLVMTHSHALDFALVERILARKDFAYLGLIGSKTKAAKFRSRLRAKGIPQETIARMVSPIGLVRNVKHPAAVAVSAVSELLSRGCLASRDALAEYPGLGDGAIVAQHHQGE
jgi:xanthine dehydrogenase accessory factor